LECFSVLSRITNIELEALIGMLSCVCLCVRMQRRLRDVTCIPRWMCVCA
jgi:hypothetical protein